MGLGGCLALPFGLGKGGSGGSSLQASSIVDPPGVYAVSPFTVKVAWAPVGSYTSFVVYSAETAGTVRLTSDFSSGWVKPLTPGLSYELHVYGLDAQGNQSQNTIKEYRVRTWKGFDQSSLAVSALDSARFRVSFDYAPWASFAPGQGVMDFTRIRCYLRSNASADDDPFDPAAAPVIVEGPLGTGKLDLDGYALGIGGTVRVGCEAVYADLSVIRNPHLLQFTPHFHLAACPSTQLTQDHLFNCPMAFVDDSGQVLTGSPALFELDPSQSTCAFLQVVDPATGQLAAAGKLVQGVPNNNQVGSCTLAYRPHGPASSNTPSRVQQLAIANLAPVFTRVGIAPYLVKNVFPATNGGFTELLADADVQTNEETQGTLLGQLFGTYAETRLEVVYPCSDYGQVKIDGATGRTLFKPDLNYYGTCNIGIQFDDGNSSSGNNLVRAVLPVHVLERNSPPEIVDGPGQGSPRIENCGDHCYVGGEYDFQLNANPGGGQYTEHDQHLSVVRCSTDSPTLLSIPYCQFDPKSHQFELTLVPLGAPAAGQAMPTVTIQLIDDGYDEHASSRDASGNWIITRQANPLMTTPFVFQVDTRQYQQKSHPAIAVNRASCLMCHANVTGDVFTDMGRESTLQPYSYFPKNTDWATSYATSKEGWGTLDSVSGSIYVPSTALPDPPTRTYFTPIPAPGSGIATYPTAPAPNFEDLHMWYWLTPGMSLAQFMSTPSVAWYKPGIYSVINGGYQSTLPENYIEGYTSQPVNTRITDRFTVSGSALPIQDIIIRFPLLSDLQAMDLHGVINWTDPTPQVAYAGRLPTDPTQAAAVFGGLGIKATLASGGTAPSAAPYISNLGPVNCVGDVLIKGTLFLQDATILGSDSQPCRLHVAGPVFIFGKDGQTEALHVQALPGQNIGTLQITSTMGVFLGEGPAALDRWETTWFAGDNLALIKPPLSATQPAPTFGGMARAIGITDAMDGCHGMPIQHCPDDAAPRSFDFHRVLLDGPYVMSRYLGLFQGAIVADYSAFRLGSLKYSYDPALDTQVAFPRLRAIRTVDHPQGLTIFDVKTQ